MIREKAESRTVMGSGFPNEFASVLCARNAAVFENEKSLALASIRITLAFPEVPSQIRRLIGPRRQAARQDVLVAADLVAASGEEDFDAWTANRKAQKEKWQGRCGDDQGKPGEGKFKDRAGTLGAFARKTGERNRCFTCKSE